ncbi:unnamed protein product [Durusdinium trenchii]|uniref:PLDc_2 domain-containing protein n=2 Tax=Durusdinium trenchii TaxID=1381693 RepID=A0ABP0LAD1_9DINO
MDEIVSSNGLVSIWDFIGEEIDSASSRGSSPTAELQGLEDIPAEDFEEPCEALGTSGGTAAFYRLRYRSDRAPNGVPLDFFIGKDLAHASDEVEFYAKLRWAVQTSDAWRRFGQRAMSCPGVARLECVNPKTQERSRRAILLLENLRQGFSQMRLLDLKMGAETSVACWKGKSRLNAWKNSLVDQRTNSACEGFRLEGIEGPPEGLEERMRQVMEGVASSKYVSPKVIKRFTLQRLRAAEILEFWLDVSHLGAGGALHAQRAALRAFEDVGSLLQAVLGLEVPQQWIGSSVALAVEMGALQAEPKVAVKVFDWGRAELNTVTEFAYLQPPEKESRAHYWKQYLRALGRLYWELGRVVLHRCCSWAWSVLVLELRSLSPTLLRAALLGEQASTARSVTHCMGLLQMDPRGGAGEVSLPLLGRPEQGSSRESSTFGLVGMLRMHVHAPVEGVGTCQVRIQEVESDLDALGLSSSLIITVRALAFERAGDARVYLEAFQSECPAPLPRGHVCAQSTPPGRFGPGRLRWKTSCLEFRAGAAEEAWAKLREGPLSRFAAAEHLPPSVALPEEVDEKAQHFLRHLLP